MATSGDSVYFLWFVHISGVKYLCYYCTKITSNTPDILRHYSTYIFHIVYHGEKVFTVRVMMLDQTGVLLYRSKHFNINSHDVAYCSVHLERPCVNEISEDCDDLEVNN